MDKAQRKDAIRAYKERKPDMGIIEIVCIPTGERFAKATMDIKEVNSQAFQLGAGLHPNRHLQDLWKRHGAEQFLLHAERLLDCKDPGKDHSEELATLLELYLADHPDAEAI